MLTSPPTVQPTFPTTAATPPTAPPETTTATAAAATCASVLDVLAGEYTCGSRIAWVEANLGKSRAAAEQQVASEFPVECGACGAPTTTTQTTTTQPPTTVARAVTLVWQDEFDIADGLPDATKWGYDVGGDGWGNGESQYYTEARKENARVEGGKLVIEAIKESHQGAAYTSARLVTRGKGDWLYGRVVVRAKLPPRGNGTWPAIWMLPTDWKYGGWPKSGELDIMEHVGHDMGKVHATVHTEVVFFGTLMRH